MGYGSFHTYTEIYKHAACSSLCMQPLAKRTQSIKKTTTEDVMNQGHHGEHAVAEWRTKNPKKKKEKKEGKEGPLYPFYGPIREGKGF